MKSAIIPMVLLLALGVVGQQAASAPTFKLFKGDKACACVNTKKQTATLTSTEKRTGKTIQQIFWSRTEPRQELFRVDVGWIYKDAPEPVKWWNYGIAEEADFNGDGVPDYAWYGGDDTSDVEYLFLSSSSGYKKVDIRKTVEAAWTNRFHKKPPDLDGYGGSYGVTDPVLERCSAGMILVETVNKLGKGEEIVASYDFRIPESDFLP